MASFNPDSYPCPTHTAKDFTDEVKRRAKSRWETVSKAVGDSAVVIGSDTFRKIQGTNQGKNKKPIRFSIPITCPGMKEGDQAAEAHNIVCEGTYTP